MSNYSPAAKIKYLLTIVFLSFFIAPAYSNLFKSSDTIKVQAKDTTKQQGPDSVLYIQRTFKAEELIRGERLFYGLVYLKNESVNCAGCHNTRVTDTLNWNPDALEISKKYLRKDAHDLSRVLLKPM